MLKLLPKHIYPNTHPTKTFPVILELEPMHRMPRVQSEHAHESGVVCLESNNILEFVK